MRRSRAPSCPAAPLLFAKFTTSLIGPGDPIVIPSLVTKCDYEAELGVVIGTTVRGVSKENALEAVAGYVVANDVSARDLQFADGQWTRGKSPDTFCPVGPLVPAADVPRPARARHPGDPERRHRPGLDDGQPHLRDRRDRQLRRADDDARAGRSDPHRHTRRRRGLPRPAAPAAARRRDHDRDRRHRLAHESGRRGQE